MPPTVAAAFVVIRMLRDEPPLCVALWAHSGMAFGAAIPLAFGVPSYATWPNRFDAMLLASNSVMSFLAQIFVTRGFRMLPAGKASAINLLQVPWSWV